MKNFITVIFCFFIIFTLQAQTFKGKIIDENKKPLPYATVYAVETRAGALTNEDGEFSIHLESGNYTVRFQYVGYETQTKQVKIPQDNQVNIKLKSAAIELKGLTIRANEEDPAYNIIRKAISKAPYYRNLLSYYKSNVYIKGSIAVNKIPKLLKIATSPNANKGENALPFKEGDIFLKESVSEIIETQGKTKQHIISENSSFPDFFDGSNDILNMLILLNIYDAKSLDEFVSPIAPSALSCYKYRLENIRNQDGFKIYHITVIPKTGKPFLFGGTIDIIDSLWSVYGFDLAGEANAGLFSYNFQLKQAFSELEKNMFQPVSYFIAINVKMFGVEFGFTNAASIKYLDYKINTSSLSGSDSIVTKKDTVPFIVSEKSKKLSGEIETLSGKEKLSNRDAMKVVQLFDKKEKEDRKNNPQYYAEKSLEEKETYFMTIDSNAHKYDSAYWKTQRTFELSEKEEQSYQQKEKFLEKYGYKSGKDSSSYKRSSFDALGGYRLRIDSTYLFKANITSDIFNTVDGFLLGLELSFRKNFHHSKWWETKLSSQYAFSSEYFPSTLTSTYYYFPRKMASVSVSGGRESSDFNRESGFTSYINAFSSLFFKQNYISFYDRVFVDFKHKIEVTNGFSINAGFCYEQQQHLHNNTDYSFFFRSSRDYRSNDPDNFYTSPDGNYLQDATGSILSLRFEYTPQMHYRYYKDRKINLYSDYPTFSLLWKKGIAGLFNANNHFDQLELDIRQSLKWRVFDVLQYGVTGGWFPYNKNMHFSNFKHFDVEEFAFMTSSLDKRYFTMKTYSPSTNEWYLSAFAQYKTPYLLIKRLPFLTKTFIHENLFVSYLKTPVVKDYMEFGYALTDIYVFGNIGVFVGFEDFKYANWGVRISISLSEFF